MDVVNTANMEKGNLDSTQALENHFPATLGCIIKKAKLALLHVRNVCNGLAVSYSSDSAGMHPKDTGQWHSRSEATTGYIINKSFHGA